MNFIEKEKLIKADIVSIENRVRHAFNQGYDLGFKDGKKAKPQDIDYKAQYERLLQKAEIVISQLRADRVRWIRPKGHWIKIGDRGFGYSDIVICKCSECEYQTEFVGKFDGHNLAIDAERADNYCSNCGADMREVEE